MNGKLLGFIEKHWSVIIAFVAIITSWVVLKEQVRQNVVAIERIDNVCIDTAKDSEHRLDVIENRLTAIETKIDLLLDHNNIETN